MNGWVKAWLMLIRLLASNINTLSNKSLSCITFFIWSSGNRWNPIISDINPLEEWIVVKTVTFSCEEEKTWMNVKYFFCNLKVTIQGYGNNEYWTTFPWWPISLVEKTGVPRENHQLYYFRLLRTTLPEIGIECIGRSNNHMIAMTVPKSLTIVRSIPLDNLLILNIQIVKIRTLFKCRGLSYIGKVNQLNFLYNFYV